MNNVMLVKVLMRADVGVYQLVECFRGIKLIVSGLLREMIVSLLNFPI